MECIKVLSAILMIAISSNSASASAGYKEMILGKWHYYKKIYNGMEMPEPPDSGLDLNFEFTEDGKDRLYWTHNDGDRCERTGEFFIDGDNLVDKVTWTNPENAIDCWQDPDMQLGKTTSTPIHFENGELYLHLFLDDKPLYYVWKHF